HTRFSRDWSSDVCSSDLPGEPRRTAAHRGRRAGRPRGRGPPARGPHHRAGAARRAAHQGRAARAARRAPPARRRRAGRAVRDPGQGRPDGRVPRPAGPEGAGMTGQDLPGVVGVYGGGRMGAGIAHAFVLAGSAVTVVETDAAAALAARERVGKSLARAAAGPGSAPAGSFDVVTDAAALAGCALVVEAVPELLGLKHEVLRRAASAAPDAALASNTSSLPIDALADALPDPSRLVGLHFFNPVPVSSLVEVVVGARTAPGLVG